MVAPPQAAPLDLDAPHPLPRLSSSLSTSASSWTPVLSVPASEYPSDCFDKTLVSLVHSPEHSSSTILRAEILADQTFEPLDLDTSGKGKEKALEGDFQVEGYELQRRIRRRILPKRPQFDHAMEQECLFYSRRHAPLSTLSSLEDSTESLVLFVVDLDSLERETGQRNPPYYHPQVSTLAFRYLPALLSSPEPSTSTLRIDLVPLPHSPLSNTAVSLDPSDRLYRTSLALVKTIDKMSKGFNTGYEKRVNHDLLVPKEKVQDVYQRLKSKYSFLASTWAEKTDPSKHVFEDVAICAWLICLWQEMYPVRKGSDKAEPQGGFVDVGCGNGLLVYLLTSEGYKGYGLDLRARRSWSLYSPPPDLRVTSLSPPTIVRSSLASDRSTPPPFPVDSFLIGNHADELSPWIPLFASVTPGSAWLNIPCCLHDLTGRFESKTYSIPPRFLDSLPCQPPSPSSTTSRTPELVIDTHPLLYPFYQPTPSYLSEKSRYGSYQLFLAHLSLLCGFLPEREALRIPSTKNYGLVGRKRLWELNSSNSGQGSEDEEDSRKRREVGEKRVEEEVTRLLDEVERKSGVEGWKARVPEGRAGEH